ncbi:hypothetical protein LVD13_02375 [Flavobacteriaceae bacterium D16]|nr:hypothetical protein [Flavobacteriaceae bacterium D16]
MKNLLLLVYLVSLTTIQAQSDEFVGIYILKKEADNGVTQHKMVLDEEGSFLFSAFFSPKDRDGKMLEIKSDYGSGKWRVNRDQVFFTVDKDKDFDTERTLDFSRTRARIQKPSILNSNGKTKPVMLVFFDSDILWVKGLKLAKQ